MDVQQTLQQLGLSEKEAAIYITLLQIGESSILDIARNSSIKRPTIYAGIESLEALGLVHRIPYGKRIAYKAEDPSKLILLQEQRKKQLQDILPQLEAITNVPRGTKPEIRYYEGKEAVFGLYKSSFSELKEGDTVDFITSLRDLIAYFPEIPTSFNRQAKQWGINVRELVPQSKTTLEYIQSDQWTVPTNPKHKVRFLPKGYDLFDSEIVIFRDKIMIVSFTKGIFGISIRSAHIVESFKTIFSFAWAMSLKEPQ